MQFLPSNEIYGSKLYLAVPRDLKSPLLPSTLEEHFAGFTPEDVWFSILAYARNPLRYIPAKAYHPSENKTLIIETYEEAPKAEDLLKVAKDPNDKRDYYNLVLPNLSKLLNLVKDVPKVFSQPSLELCPLEYNDEISI